MTRTAGIALAVVAGLAIAGGLYATGGPQTARQERLDQHRLSELREMMRVIERWQEGGNPLPDDVSGLPQRHLRRDPVTDEVFFYERVDAGSFRVCARFDRPEPERLPIPADHTWSGPDADGRFCIAPAPAG